MIPRDRVAGMQFPGGKNFAFTVFDDTDDATVENIRPVYELLVDCGMRTTKSVWVYPPRGSYTSSSLADSDYLQFIRSLKERGFEIGLHNIGDGFFSRAEILRGFEIFRELLGHEPGIHANHVSNPDNLYWWDRRFEWPFDLLYRLLSGRARRVGGEDKSSESFWGDVAKTHIRYMRNLTFNDVNTLARDPRMPYRVDRKSECSNLWFSSSDGQTVDEFTDLIAAMNVDRLSEEGGVCIVYTHFASGFTNGSAVHPEFERRLRYLASRAGGWFAPVSTVLDHLVSVHGGDADPGYAYRLVRNVWWGIDRLRKRVRYRR